MSQYLFENIDPYTDTGVDLATDLNSWKAAIQSSHKGNARPSYAVAGTLWINDTSAPWKVNVYNGTTDVEIGTMNATTSAFIPTISTPAQFNNSTTPATTAFVQRALGNANGIYVASTTQTLPTSTAGSLVGITAEGISITLPSRASLVSGATFFIKSTSAAGASTVLPPAGDQFVCASGTLLSSVVLNSGDEVTLTAFGSTWVASGPAVSKHQSIWGSSLSTNGYQKLPSGLIVQWGTAGTNTSGIATFTHPIAFPNGYLKGLVNYQAPSLVGDRSLTFGGGSTTASTAYLATAAGAAVNGAAIAFFVLGY